MRVLVTGANGFIGKHMCLLLARKGHEVFKYDIDSTEAQLVDYVKNSDAVIHLAGINRPLTPEEFYDGNTNFTKKLADLLKENNKNIPDKYKPIAEQVLDVNLNIDPEMNLRLFYENLKRMSFKIVYSKDPAYLGMREYAAAWYNSLSGTIKKLLK